MTLTVQAVNDGSSISDITDGVIDKNIHTGEISFTIKDADTAANDLVLSASSSNQGLIPDSAIVFGGASENCTVKVTPTRDRSGKAEISIKVSDGSTEATDAFTLTVRDMATPTVNEVSPLNSAKNVLRTTSVKATFSEEINPDTITTSTVKLSLYDKKKKWIPVTNTTAVTCDSPCKTAALDPYGTSPTLLGANKKYKVIITTGVKDTAGNTLSNDFS